MTIQITRTLVAGVLVAMIGIVFPACAEQARDIKEAYREGEHIVAVKALLEKMPKSVVGETIAYPGGTPAEITAAIITLSPGQKTSWHKHGVPLFAYMLSGVLDVDYGDQGIRSYPAGTAFMEAMDHRHRGINNSDMPASVLVVYLGAAGLKNVIRE